MVFRRAMRRLLRDPTQAFSATSSAPHELISGWGNESWSAGPEFLSACANEALVARGPILECGSGLTTLVVGAIAQRSGKTLWSLEHSPEWGGRVRTELDEFGIDSVQLSVAPLGDWGECDWYQPPLAQMPEAFDLVLCDGPPNATRGGRAGPATVMRERLTPGCVILLDDASRAAESKLAQQMSVQLQSQCQLLGEQKPYFRLCVGSHAKGHA